MSGIFSQFIQWLHDVFVAQWDGWIVLGFIAQALFMMRFVVQWLASEKAKKSVMPVAFLVFFTWRRCIFAHLCYSAERSGFYCRSGFGIDCLYPQPLSYLSRKKHKHTGV